MKNLKEQFLLDPGITYLNHGSFGACPRPVFDEYQKWQCRLERQPVRFFVHEFLEELHKARMVLGEFVNADPDNLVYVPNVTFAVNVVAQSLPLQEGDEVLATDHEYGACDNMWQYICGKRNAGYIRHHIPLPLESSEAFLEQFLLAVTPRTKVIFLSHISSSTAHHFPVEEICQCAREKNIITLIDGAHTIGQVPLDLQKIDADFYTGNAHKWLCAPKGAAFLYARKEMQSHIRPLIVGWGWGENKEFTCGSPFLDYFQWMGTGDYSAYLSVPAAIRFQEENNWHKVREDCHTLLATALKDSERISGYPSMYRDGSFYHQMAVFQIPQQKDAKAFKTKLYKTYRIEIPVTMWNDLLFLRVSVQGYNTQANIDTLLDALKDILK